MTTLVHSDHLALWDISLEELGILAEENTPRMLPSPHQLHRIHPQSARNGGHR